jgi:hypothetical protein
LIGAKAQLLSQETCPEHFVCIFAGKDNWLQKEPLLYCVLRLVISAGYSIKRGLFIFNLLFHNFLIIKIMKKKVFLISVVLTLSVLLFSCSRDEVTNSPVSNTQGILVLYEGGLTPGSGDYAFINTNRDTVFNDVYRNSNNNANLGLFPDGMYLYGQYLYVTSQGNYGGPGKMFMIGSTDNKLLDTLTFGTNPYDIELSQGDFWVTNIGGSTVTRIDGNLNIVNTIQVGANPTKIVNSINHLYVAKASYTSEYSVAVINKFDNSVTKVFFNYPPVSIAPSYKGVYVSAYTDKKLYLIDTLQFNNIVDSISCSSVQNDAVGEVTAGDNNTLYVVGTDTALFGNTGKTVYRVDIAAKNVTQFINDPQIMDIYGIAYNPVKEQIVIADSRSGSEPGQVRVYDKNGSLLRMYQLTGYYPRKFAFKN